MVTLPIVALLLGLSPDARAILEQECVGQFMPPFTPGSRQPWRPECLAWMFLDDPDTAATIVKSMPKNQTRAAASLNFAILARKRNPAMAKEWLLEAIATPITEDAYRGSLAERAATAMNSFEGPARDEIVEAVIALGNRAPRALQRVVVLDQIRQDPSRMSHFAKEDRSDPELQALIGRLMADQSPDASYRFAISNPDLPQRGSFLAGVAENIAHRDPERALELMILAHPESPNLAASRVLSMIDRLMTLGFEFQAAELRELLAGALPLHRVLKNPRRFSATEFYARPSLGTLAQMEDQDSVRYQDKDELRDFISLAVAYIVAHRPERMPRVLPCAMAVNTYNRPSWSFLGLAAAEVGDMAMMHDLLLRRPNSDIRRKMRFAALALLSPSDVPTSLDLSGSLGNVDIFRSDEEEHATDRFEILCAQMSKRTVACEAVSAKRGD